MVKTDNYKVYIAQNSLILPNSLVGSFRKKDDPEYLCEIIVNEQKVDEAGFSECATTMYPDKAVIYITRSMLEALQGEDDIAIFYLYRELGHVECGHFNVPENLDEFTEEQNAEMIRQQEFEADAFAAEFIGKEKTLEVLKNLLSMRAKVDRELHLNGTPESVKRIRDYRARIKAMEE